MASRNVTRVEVTEDPQAYEDTHVHAVYDQIAPHFSSTRYKPWPIIAQFLSEIPTGSVGLDSGTGNGKYLGLPADRRHSLWTVGLDRSRGLLEIAKHAGGSIREVVWGDVLGHGWRNGAFDFAISIATIHHLANQERRTLAIQQLLRSVSPAHGRILIYVWAVEQDPLSKRTLPAETQTSNPGQDVFVPWVLSKEASASPGPERTQSEPVVLNRYYHFFSKGELASLVGDAAKELGLHVGSRSDSQGTVNGVEIIQDGWERSNYYVELRCWQK